MQSLIRVRIIIIRQNTHSNKAENEESHQHYLVFCFVCLWFFVPLENFFTHIKTSPLQVKGCKFPRHLWPLSSEGSLACHIYCDTGHPFIMVISEELWHWQLLPSAWRWSCHYMYLFLGLLSVAAGIRTPNLPLAGRTIIQCQIRLVLYLYLNVVKIL